jgi:hypothetical protein
MTSTSPTPDEGTEPSDPITRQDPDLDPGLAPDLEHEIQENPPEGAGPTGS